MNRRRFGTTAAVWLAGMCGLPKSKAKGGITVHGPELIDIHDGHNKLRATVSLRFRNVPLGESGSVEELARRLRSIGGTVNRSEWRWYEDPTPTPASALPIKQGKMTELPAGYDVFQPKYLPLLNTHLARTLMFTEWGTTVPENGFCNVFCAFTPASDRPPWPGSHRPVDFETEILKALGDS